MDEPLPRYAPLSNQTHKDKYHVVPRLWGTQSRRFIEAGSRAETARHGRKGGCWRRPGVSAGDDAKGLGALCVYSVLLSPSNSPLRADLPKGSCGAVLPGAPGICCTLFLPTLRTRSVVFHRGIVWGTCLCPCLCRKGQGHCSALTVPVDRISLQVIKVSPRYRRSAEDRFFKM